MTVLHICDGWDPTNGAAKVARLIADEQRRGGAIVRCCRWASIRELRRADEVWIHCAWKPCLWWASLWARRSVRMPHGSFDPVRLAYHGWKKLLVGAIERWAVRRAAKVVVTCAAEERWVRAYEPRVSEVEVTDLKRFFDVDAASRRVIDGEDSFSERRGETPRLQGDAPLHILYLGRRHPLKGLNYLEHAVSVLNRPPLSTSTSSLHLKPSPPQSTSTSSLRLSLRIVSDHVGDELERDWDWCDVLVLPTLSENFGLVVAEALERGKRVIVTDGAPAWEPPNGADTDYGGRLRYIRGFVAADDETRVCLLSAAMKDLMEQENDIPR